MKADLNPKEYVIKRLPMISGQGEAVERKYFLYVGKSGNSWLVANQPNCADNIYVTNNPENSGGEGFGGAVLKMPLMDGTVFELRGGWHSNADSFFYDTGIDVRNRTYTRVVVAKGRKSDAAYNTVLTDVLYYEDEYHLGEFERYKKIAQELADELGEQVYYYSESSGGSSCGPVKPNQGD